ncbi:universal stress protein [Burkholderia perseverans]|uniref:universal stress protein n=1 Tax=Burkholderia perseverans TaxID=2615214 RepID=UPI001FEE936A|nr:universal stress protein [Burkholderia perseverans]
MFTNVLIALDGSASGECVLRLAAAIATGETRLSVLCVVDAGYRQVDAAPDGREPDGLLYPRAVEQTAHGERVVAEAVAYLTSRGRQATGWLCDGPPADTVVAEARRIDADLVVMGHRHLSRLRRWADPSTADAVIDRAPCPVLVDAGELAVRETPARAAAE